LRDELFAGKKTLLFLAFIDMKIFNTKYCRRRKQHPCRSGFLRNTAPWVKNPFSGHFSIKYLGAIATFPIEKGFLKVGDNK